jgi:hypothetical protein
VKSLGRWGQELEQWEKMGPSSILMLCNVSECHSVRLSLPPPPYLLLLFLLLLTPDSHFIQVSQIFQLFTSSQKQAGTYKGHLFVLFLLAKAQHTNSRHTLFKFLQGPCGSNFTLYTEAVRNIV